MNTRLARQAAVRQVEACVRAGDIPFAVIVVGVSGDGSSVRTWMSIVGDAVTDPATLPAIRQAINGELDILQGVGSN